MHVYLAWLKVSCSITKDLQYSLLHLREPDFGNRDKILERLQAVYEEGDIVPIPFLKAADAVPTALLDDIRKPYMQPGTIAPAIVRLGA